MQKDVIYIDVEDDITAIIGKVKAAKEKIVALVPPKRIGVLQSAVNLRLIARSAENGDKRLVLITNNQALIALSAAAKIPVAKNLQTKPELAQIAALEVDDGEDIIDGAQLPVGDLVRTADSPAESPIDSAVGDIKRGETAPVARGASTLLPAQQPFPKSSKAKVPNFNKFRKRLFLIIAGIILLIAFFVWAIFFAPHATVVITAKTSSLSVDEQLALDPSASTSYGNSVLHTVVKQQKKTQTINFTPTGTKDIGNKASGSVVFSNCDSNSSETISAGTYLSVGGLNYVLQSDTVVSGGNFSHGSCSTAGSSSPATITATNVGDEYNTAANVQLAVSGYTDMNAVSAAGITGGTHKQVTVVTATDIQIATQQLTSGDDGTMKTQLKSALGKDTVAIDQSYNSVQANPVSTPAVGVEVDSGKATLTQETTYTIIGVPKSDLGSYLDAALADALKSRTDQRVYDNGLSSVSFTQFVTSGSASTVKLSATAQVGPKIDDNQIKNQSKGKNYGDVQAQLQAIPGINNVDVKFSPFWVQKVPNDVNKISVKFILQHGS